MAKRRSDLSQQNLSDENGEITPHVRIEKIEKLAANYFAAKAREAKACSDKTKYAEEIFDALDEAVEEGLINLPRYPYTNKGDEMMFEITDKPRLSVRRIKKEELEEAA